MLGLVLCGGPLLMQAQNSASQPLIIQHVTVIDATGAPPKPDVTVQIEDGRITLVGNESSRRKDGSRANGPATSIDGSGKYLIPGLWDMHVHLAGVNADPKWSKETLLPLLVANGITGVRDMGGNLDALLQWKKEIAAGTLLAPHLVVAGPMLELATQPQPEVAIVRTPEDGRKTMDDLATRGVDFIKTLSCLSRESFLAIAAEAREKIFRSPATCHSR